MLSKHSGKCGGWEWGARQVVGGELGDFHGSHMRRGKPIAVVVNSKRAWDGEILGSTVDRTGR